MSSSRTNVSKLLVYPGRYVACRRRPSHGIGNVGFDLTHALVTMVKHRLVPLGLSSRSVSMRPVRSTCGPDLCHQMCGHDINRHPLTARALHRAADASQRAKVVVNCRNTAQLNQDSGRQDRRLRALCSANLTASLPFHVGHRQSPALRIAVRKFFLVFPAPAIQHQVDVGTVCTLRIAENTQRRLLQIAAMLFLICEHMFTK